jgi:hypothetical protein
MANTLVHSILLAGTATLLRDSIKTIGEPSAYSPQQWQVWESKSIFNVSGEAAIKMVRTAISLRDKLLRFVTDPVLGTD